MAERPPLSGVPDPSALQDATGRYVWAYFKRMDQDPPTVHVLPTTGSSPYPKKTLPDGSPLFVQVANAQGDPLVPGNDPAVPVLDYVMESRTRRSGKPVRKG